jgi:hypothetical protein
MENIILHSIPLSEFQTIIGQVVRDELRQFKPEPTKPTTDGEYLTRREVCKRLKISLTTLHNYSKLGILNPLQIGGKILYKAQQIDYAVSEIQSVKYKPGR